MMIVWTLLLTVLIPHVELCTVSGGEFLQIIQVNEETTIGSLVGQLNFDNPKTVSNIRVTEDNFYIAFESQRNDDGEMGGVFTVANTIDVDQGLNRIQTMYLECTTTTRLKLEIEVEIELIDINDHTPEFTPSDLYEFSISERAQPGTQIGVVKAKDGDRMNSFVLYELVTDEDTDMGLFELKPLPNGGAKITLLSSLDYEKRSSYNLQIVAKDCQHRSRCDEGQRSSLATVAVSVLDADDLNPEFDQQSYPVSLSDQASNGVLVVEVAAHDQDSLSDPLTYSMSGENSHYFSIDSDTGKVTVRDNSGLTAGENFLFQVKATQKSDRSKSDTVPLFISVFSPDSDKPKFTERAYTKSISENLAVNTTILSIAINYNIQPNIPEMFRHHFKPKKSPPLVVQIEEEKSEEEPFFEIEHTDLSVDVILIREVDFEVQRLHKVKITAANDKYSDEVEVVVHVLNENDNNPVFDKKSYRYLYVEYAAGGAVGTVSATDADDTTESAKITYRMLHSDNSLLFDIDPMTGVITLSANVSDYNRGTYTLIIEAADSGDPPRTTNVLVMTSVTVPSLAVTAEGVHIDEILDQSGGDKVIMYTVAGVAGLLLILVALMGACFLKRRSDVRREARHKKKTYTDKNIPLDKSLLPLTSSDSNHEMALSMLTPNGRHEATYRNMSELSTDENYCSMWNSSISDGGEESKTLIASHHSPEQNAASSDSGRSSGDESRQYCADLDDSDMMLRDHDHQDTPRKRGAISQIMQKQKARQNSPIPEGRKLIPAPAGFRSGRPASPTLSMLSDDVHSNTSDYGSHIEPSDKSCQKLGRLKDSLLPQEFNSSEPALHLSNNSVKQEAGSIIVISPKKAQHKVIGLSTDSVGSAKYKTPFTTFHGGDIV